MRKNCICNCLTNFWGFQPPKMTGIFSKEKIKKMSGSLLPSEEERAALQTTLDCRITTDSRRQYRSSAARFLFWLHSRCPGSLRSEFLQGVDTVTKDIILQRLCNPNPQNPPIDLQTLPASTFLTWIQTLKTEDNKTPAFSTLNGHRSGFKNLYREYKVSMDPAMEEEIDSHFGGKKKQLAKEVAETGGKARTGKAPLPFSIYKAICKGFLEIESAEAQFAGLFFRLGWNLMCRSNNTSKIAFNHLEWENDSLIIFFVHSKTDQDGDKPRHPRACFANPYDFTQCLITAIGVYLLLYTPDSTQNFLFPGSRQYDRFRAQLQRVLDLPSVAAALARKGLAKEDIGSHSTRKGSASLVACGTTAAPSMTSGLLRGGWALPGVGDTYFHPDPASDHYIGRMLAGLDPMTANFAVLPPFFDSDSPLISDAIRECFPGLPQNLNELGEFALASLVWHAQDILDLLSPRHPLRSTTLFRNPSLRESLKPLIQCRVGREGDRISATGIPPHVPLIQKVNEMGSHLIELLPVIREVAPTAVQGLIAELEKRALNANAVTYDGLDAAITRVLERLGLTQLMELLQNQSLPSREQTSPELPSRSVRSSVPTDFKFPSVSVLTMIHLWYFGNPEQQLPPFRDIRRSDLAPSKDTTNRMADLRYFIQSINEVAGLSTSPTSAEINENFATCVIPLIQGPRKTQKKWRSFVNDIRTEKKKQRTG